MAKSPNTKKTTEKNKLSDVLIENEPVNIDVSKTTKTSVQIDNSALINVKSNVFGELIYIDPVTNECITWPACGAIQQLTLDSLRHMKSGAVKFFTNQLIIITGFADENAEKYEVADIYKALYITNYYQNILDPSDYDTICSWTPAQIRENLALISAPAKEKLMVALNTYIEKGILDSLKAIKTFEEVLGCELTRPE